MSSITKEIFLLTVFFMLQSGTNGQLTVGGLPIPAGGSVPPRMEIRPHLDNPQYRNIFLLGLDCLQKANRTDPLSFRLIAAIHGANTPWNGDSNYGRYGGSGFCPHGNPLFPTWHRPYLALFEQTLLACAKRIINDFTPGDEKDAYMAACDTWRLPYWDWAQEGQMPDVLGGSPASQYVTVRKMQNGSISDVIIRNPCYSYILQPAGDSMASMSGWQNVETVRCAYRQSNGAYVSNLTIFSKAINAANSGLRDMVEAMYENATTYSAFATSANSRFSLENPHNLVHTTVGTSNSSTGHMGVVPYSAFDPIFFLHHTNVDRLFAIWQVLFPNQYVGASGTRTNFINGSTPLYPFRRADNNQYWTSTMVRDTRDLGYTYPEIADGNRATTVSQVKSLYDADVSRRRKRNLNIIDRLNAEQYSDYPAQYAQARGYANGNAGILASHFKYRAHVTIPNSVADGSFTVNFFLCEPQTDETNYHADSCFIGNMGIFSSPELSKSHKRLYNGIVSLTEALEDRYATGELRDLQTKTVTTYLKKRLIWKIVGNRNVGCDMEGLDIHVVKTRVDVPNDKYSLPYCAETTQLYKVV